MFRYTLQLVLILDCLSEGCHRRFGKWSETTKSDRRVPARFQVHVLVLEKIEQDGRRRLRRGGSDFPKGHDDLYGQFFGLRRSICLQRENRQQVGDRSLGALTKIPQGPH